MVAQQQNPPPAAVLSGADRLRLRREAHLAARSEETTSDVNLFEDLQPAARTTRQTSRQHVRNESMVPENLPGEDDHGLRPILMASIESAPPPEVIAHGYNSKKPDQSGPQKRRMSSVTSSQPGVTKKLKTKESAHVPKKEKGAVAVQSGDIDMGGAVLGEYDPSKFCIAFDTQKPHPTIDGELVKGKRVEYDLRDIDSREFDFNNKADIKRINVWRRQIFLRNFPKMRKTRQFWLESEKEYVVYLVTKQLKSSSHVKWRRLANKFNAHYHGTTQRTGEKLLLAGRQKLGVITEDRPAPWRTSPAIQGQANKWKDLKDIIRKADNKASKKVSDDEGSGCDDEGSSSEDEDEIPDPDPNPEPTVTPRKYPRYRSQTPAKAKSSSFLKCEVAEDQMEIEEGCESSDSDEVML